MAAEYNSHNGGAKREGESALLGRREESCEQGDVAVGSDIPSPPQSILLTDGEGQFWRTGVVVVSSQPQSTTSPVTRPQAAKASRLEGAKDMEGTYGDVKLERSALSLPQLRPSSPLDCQTKSSRYPA